MAALRRPRGPVPSGLRSDAGWLADSGYAGGALLGASRQDGRAPVISDDSGSGRTAGPAGSVPVRPGREQQLTSSLVRSSSGVVLICWEHNHIPVIASSLPVVSGTAIPRKWPDDRYDVIWSFTLVPGPGPVRYIFGQIPQLLLAGD